MDADHPANRVRFPRLIKPDVPEPLSARLLALPGRPVVAVPDLADVAPPLRPINPATEARSVNADAYARAALDAADLRAVLTRAAEAAGKDDAEEIASCIDWAFANPSTTPLNGDRA